MSIVEESNKKSLEKRLKLALEYHIPDFSIKNIIQTGNQQFSLEVNWEKGKELDLTTTHGTILKIIGQYFPHEVEEISINI